MDAYELENMESEAIRLTELVKKGSITEHEAANRLFEFTETGITREASEEIISDYLKDPEIIR